MNSSESLINYIDIDRIRIYQEANELHNVDLVRKLNDTGMKPRFPAASGPAIVSSFMDIATKHDVILNFMKELRQNNKLLTEKEFSSFDREKWIKKYSFSRILGSNYIKKITTEKNSTHIKVPLKIAVISEEESIQVDGWEFRHNLYDIRCDQMTIYAEKIQKVNRKLTRDEIDELIVVIAAANFVDLWPGNFVVAVDGVYCIDTEFKSFSGSICWGKMGRFDSLIDEKDKAYFQQKVEEKMNEQTVRKQDEGYEILLDRLETYKELSPEKYRDKILDIERKISELEYVGAKKVGSDWLHPNKFSFPIKDILT